MRTILLIAALLAAMTVQAEENQPPWLQPEVLKAAGGIGLSKEQMPKFRQSVTDLVNNQRNAANRLLRRNNVANLERKMRTASNRQFKKMDKSVKEYLTEDQYPQYVVYRKALQKEMRQAARNRSGTNSDALGDIVSGLDGYDNN